MIEPAFHEDLRLLANALRHDGFRFVVIGHNHRSIFKDINEWLRSQFPDRPFLELHFEGKDYRHNADELLALKKGIVLIPDFDWLFREENQAACVAFNQRRDAFARLDLAMLCFVQPSNYLLVPKKVPDWWSLRSLDLEFQRDIQGTLGGFLKQELENSSLGGETREDKEAEIERLLRQIDTAEPGNKSLLQSLCLQVGNLFHHLAQYQKALFYYENSLNFSREIGDRNSEATILNNIGQAHMAKGDYDTAIGYLQQSLKITQEIGDRQGEGIALNNISLIHSAKGDFDQALGYLQQSLKIMQEIGDQQGGGATLNNISQIYDAKGDYDRALEYLQQSLKIRQEMGDRKGEGATLNNISQIYTAKGDYNLALGYLQQSLKITKEIGDRKGEGTTLNNISQIYDAKGDYDRALGYLQQSLLITQEIGDRQGEGRTLNNISQIHQAKGDYDLALEYLQQSLTIQQEIGDRKGEGTTLNNISLIHLAKGDSDRALGCLQQSIKITQEIGDRAGMCPTLHNMAFIYLQQKGDVENFLRHEQTALQIALEIGNVQGIFEIGRVFGQFLCENGAAEQGLPILSLALQAGQQADFPGTAEVAAVIQQYTKKT